MDRTDYQRAFDFAADVRKFEIGLFWQRSLYFWGFIAAATLVYGAAYQKSRDLQFAAAIVGFASALFWTLANRSSLYWQKHWELQLEDLQLNAVGLRVYPTPIPCLSQCRGAAHERRTSLSKFHFHGCNGPGMQQIAPLPAGL
jgi:hypothetical protein